MTALAVLQASYDSLRDLLAAEELPDSARKSLERAVQAIAEVTGVVYLESRPCEEASPAPSPAALVPPKEYLNPREAAELLRVSEKTLEAWRASGKGPKYKKLGSRVRYRREDL